MTINLNKYQADLTRVFNQVIDPKDKVDWAIFGYEGTSNTLKVLEFGDEGLEEMSGSFSGGQVQYGQGEGVSTTRLGSTATHIQEVKRFFKPHITHYARDDDEVEADVLRDLVKKVTSSMQVSAQSSSVPHKEAVGSVYQKVEATKAIDVKAREEFWKQSEREEAARQKEEAAKAAATAAQAEKERRALAAKIEGEAKALAPKPGAGTDSDRLRAERKAEMESVLGGPPKRSGLASKWEQMHRETAAPPKPPPVLPKAEPTHPINGNNGTNGAPPRDPSPV